MDHCIKLTPVPGRVRVNRLTIENMKSVLKGTIELDSLESLLQKKSSILGLYGQNGSGKTVFIDALNILKHILAGRQVPSNCLDCISIGKETSSLEIEFLVVDDDELTQLTIVYKCELAKRHNPNYPTDNSSHSDVDGFSTVPKSIIAVVSESVKAFGTIRGKKLPLQTVAETNEKQELIMPETKCNLLFGNDSQNLKYLKQQKLLALYGSRSFIFSIQALDALKNGAFSQMLQCIQYFANTKFFIVGGEFSNDTIAFYFAPKESGLMVSGRMQIPLIGRVEVPQKVKLILEALIPSVNLVLSSLIPGLSIKYKCQKTSVDEKNETYDIEFFSVRENIGEFPLKDESLGIKKLISILTLIIAAYNDASFTLAVDELDSSIFEFLLGEIVSVMKDYGKGQLIFTSHNLRPLERLDSKSISFTTTDMNERYVSLSIKRTNNLRDVYFRAISLGHDKAELYNGKSKNDIAYSFRQAWEDCNG